MFMSNASAQGFLVTWQPNPTEEQIDYYCLYRDGDLIATEYDTSYTDTSLTTNEWHEYHVRAVSVNGVSEPSNIRRGLWLSWNNELNYKEVCYLDSVTVVVDPPPGGMGSVIVTIKGDVVTMRSVYDVNRDGRISLSDLGALDGKLPEGFLELYGKPCVWRVE